MTRDASNGAPPLRVIQPTEWAAIETAMSAAPVTPVVWNLKEGVSLPPRAVVMTRLGTDQGNQYMLVVDGKVFAQIGVPSHPWLGRFLEKLGNAAGAAISLEDWIGALGLTPKEFCDTLNSLYQFGFVLPVALDAPKPASRVIPGEYAKRVA